VSGAKPASRLFEIARLLARFNHVASVIGINARIILPLAAS
jgi:hypothetical protein